MKDGSVAQSYLTLSDPTDCSMPGFPVHHQLLDLAQPIVHWDNEVIQPSHPLLSPSPPTFSLSQHQGLFQWVSSFHQVPKVLEFQCQDRSFQWIFRTDFLWYGLFGSPSHPNSSLSKNSERTKVKMSSKGQGKGILLTEKTRERGSVRYIMRETKVKP